MDSAVVRVQHDVFGIDVLSAAQEAAVSAVLSDPDVVVLLPTGGGKSLCFQLPAIAQEGVTVVVTPLLALGQDQVEYLKSIGINAAFYSGSETSADRVACLKDDTVKLLYTTPEQLATSSRLLKWLKTKHKDGNLRRIVLDEAHCVCTWGADFRKSYRDVGVHREELNVPFTAATATATPAMVEDITDVMKSSLNPQGVTVVQLPFFRKNLRLSVVAKSRSAGSVQLAQFLKPRLERDEAGIMYVRTRAEADEWAARLKKLGFPVYAFHAGHSAEHKATVLSWWKSDAAGLIVATIAFGMGIHRDNVRFVLHWCIPSSVLSYFQEIGRAGRDGEFADCVLFYSEEDVCMLKDTMFKSHARGVQWKAFGEMRSWCKNTKDCRHAGLLKLFSQTATDCCGDMCDVCKS